MNNFPLVSVYITTKNRPKLLCRALNSIYLQTYDNIEVLVCDDGSDVDLSFIKDFFIKLFKRFIWIKNDVSLGVSSSRNKLIELASGEYVTGLDDDDEFLFNRIESFVSFSYNSNYSFLCSRYFKIYNNNIVKDKKTDGEISYKLLLKDNYVGNQVFIKRQFLLDIGGFDDSLSSRALEDYNLWIKVAKIYGNGYRINLLSYKIYFNSHDYRKYLDKKDASRKLDLFFNSNPEICFFNKLNIKVTRYLDGKYILSFRDVFLLLFSLKLYQLLRIFNYLIFRFKS